MATIEDLYKYFGILADAKEDAGKVKNIFIKKITGVYLIIISACRYISQNN
jgi:hypothetical protein